LWISPGTVRKHLENGSACTPELQRSQRCTGLEKPTLPGLAPTEICSNLPLVFRVAVGLCFLAFGLCLLLHAEFRRRRWARIPNEPIPLWQYMVLGGRLSGEPSIRSIEQEGTVVQALAGAVSLAIGVAAVVIFA
jgi:hypothetical protein